MDEIVQEIADILVGIFVVFLGYRFVIRFGAWVEKRSERALKEALKEAKRGQR